MVGWDEAYATAFRSRWPERLEAAAPRKGVEAGSGSANEVGRAPSRRAEEVGSGRRG